MDRCEVLLCDDCKNMQGIATLQKLGMEKSSFWQGPWGNEQEVVRTDFRFHCPSGASAQHVGPRWVSRCYGSCGGFLSTEVQIRDFPSGFCWADFLHTGRFGIYTYICMNMYVFRAKQVIWFTSLVTIGPRVILKSHSRVEKLQPVFGMKSSIIQ